jgi:hypothetical protein
LWLRKWTFEFHKRRGISWLAEEMCTSQEELYMKELFILPPCSKSCSKLCTHMEGGSVCF